MPLPLLGLGIASGVSALGSLLSNRGRKVTQSTEPTYTHEQDVLRGLLSGALTTRLMNPTYNLDPLKVGAMGQINQEFDSAQENLESRLAARGFGRSGKLVANTRAIETARAGALGGLEGKFAGLALDQENRVLDDALRFAFAGPGSSSTQNIPGNMLGGGISAGGEAISTLFLLNQMLKGGG